MRMNIIVVICIVRYYSLTFIFIIDINMYTKGLSFYWLLNIARFGMKTTKSSRGFQSRSFEEIKIYFLE